MSGSTSDVSPLKSGMNMKVRWDTPWVRSWPFILFEFSVVTPLPSPRELIGMKIWLFCPPNSPTHLQFQMCCSRNLCLSHLVIPVIYRDQWQYRVTTWKRVSVQMDTCPQSRYLLEELFKLEYWYKSSGDLAKMQAFWLGSQILYF